MREWYQAKIEFDGCALQIQFTVCKKNKLALKCINLSKHENATAKKKKKKM